MPGLVVFGRRWSVGSDDLIVPALVLFILHVTWLIILLGLLLSIPLTEWRILCMRDLHEHTLGYVIILGGTSLIEGFICLVSSRGTILNQKPRAGITYLVYCRLAAFLLEIFWLSLGVIWLRRHYKTCPNGLARDMVLAVTLTNWLVVGSILLTVWCTFDSAGRSWVKMKRFQDSLNSKDATDGATTAGSGGPVGQAAHAHRFRYRRSANSSRNWRQRKAMREYQKSWDRRFKFLCCCMGKKDRNQNSFTEIARLLSEFFRDLDVVPSDIVAGLILLRKAQKKSRRHAVTSREQPVFQFLSGVPVTADSRFLDVASPTGADAELIRELIHYCHYAVAIYGWPMMMFLDGLPGCVPLCSRTRCCACAGRTGIPLRSTCCAASRYGFKPSERFPSAEGMVGDNCCACNSAAIEAMCDSHDFTVIYCSHEVAVGQPPFLVALDHGKQTVIISIRGTLSLQDVITDLNAEGEPIPLDPHSGGSTAGGLADLLSGGGSPANAAAQEGWTAHKGIIAAAVYVKKCLEEQRILERAFFYAPEMGTHAYGLVLVGHSLGAGTAAILSILLHDKFPFLKCYCYAPPGGLLSLPLVEHSKDYIISVVCGKDLVPRLGLHQLEALRFDIISAIGNSKNPKWSIIGRSMFGCCCPSRSSPSHKKRHHSGTSDQRGSRFKNGGSGHMKWTSRKNIEQEMNDLNVSEPPTSTSGNAPTLVGADERDLSQNPNNAAVSLTVHEPLYPPGRIIHIVRNHPRDEDKKYETRWRKVMKRDNVVYQALWVDNTTLNEIIISPVMVHDHWPDRLMESMEKLLINTGPAKPGRVSTSRVGQLTTNTTTSPPGGRSSSSGGGLNGRPGSTTGTGTPLLAPPHHPRILRGHATASPMFKNIRSDTPETASTNRTPSRTIVGGADLVDLCSGTLPPGCIDDLISTLSPTDNNTTNGSQSVASGSVTAESILRRPTLLTVLKRSGRQDLLKGVPAGKAPLATPESVPEAASGSAPPLPTSKPPSNGDQSSKSCDRTNLLECIEETLNSRRNSLAGSVVLNMEDSTHSESGSTTGKNQDRDQNPGQATSTFELLNEEETSMTYGDHRTGTDHDRNQTESKLHPSFSEGNISKPLRFVAFSSDQPSTSSGAGSSSSKSKRQVTNAASHPSTSGQSSSGVSVARPRNESLFRKLAASNHDLSPTSQMMISKLISIDSPSLEPDLGAPGGPSGHQGRTRSQNPSPSTFVSFTESNL